MLGMKRFRYLTICILVLLSPAATADEIFPRPPELQPDVDFWIDVFTEYSVDEGVLHDNRNLGVVYDRLNMPAGLSRKERNRRVERRRRELRAVLQSLASGKRDNLSTEEARVLALWPANVSDETLVRAARQIRYQQGLRERFGQGLERAGPRSTGDIERDGLGLRIEPRVDLF